MPIHFFLEEVSYKIPKVKKIKAWVSSSCKMEGFGVGDINYILCNDSYLLKMNIEFLNHKTLTDIITFDYSDENKISGDIFISLVRIEENAAKFSVSIETELKRVMIHGVLHLMGYSDKSKTQKTLMRKKEDQYLSLWKD